jgi:pimeloyl-ACP methyl ester carboxylesterase
MAQAPRIAGTEERWADIDGCRVRYLFAGQGKPLLLIHGLLGYSFSWRYNFEALGETRAVYAIDLPGAGFSERRCDLACGMRESAERVRGFLDELKIDKADVLGTSHGGALAMYMAAMAPERIENLILVAPANPWSRFRQHVIRSFATRFGAAVVRFGTGAMSAVSPPALQFVQDFFLKRVYGDATRIPPETAEGYSAPLQDPGALEYALKVVRCWRGDMNRLAGLMEGLADLRVLLVWGTADGAVDPKSAYELKRRLPKSELEMLEGIGHLPYEEDPAEFNRVVLRFLAGADEFSRQGATSIQVKS